MDTEFFSRIINSSVELALLAGVLYGLYRLTIKAMLIVSVHVERCCESLERIADALEGRKTD